MNQYKVERRLCLIYSIIVALATITSICCAVAWNHWKLVIDLCPLNCGCILYGRMASYFEGGSIGPCIWAVFGPLPVIGVALVMGGYHFLRVCINNIGKYENGEMTTVEQREGDVVMVATRTKARNTDSVVYCWTIAAVFCAIFSLYCLIHAAILTDGFYKTCNQYRGELIKSIRASGNQVSVIHSRLGCSAVFDFMDYLQPDVLDRRRGEIINTGLSLQIAIACSWFTVILWISATIINSLRAYKDRHVLTCCGK